MALKFKTVKANKATYGNKRDTSNIKYIVLHYTGCKRDTALNNCKYFQGGNRHASAHYFVDGGTYIYRSVPDDYVAWSVGGYYGNDKGGAKYYKKCTNANSISIEMCNSVDKVPEDTYEQVIELVKYLMKKYNVPVSRVIRHQDVSGKHCPLPWIGEDNKLWKQFKEDIVSEVKKFAVGDYNATVKTTKQCAVRTGRGVSYKKLGTIKLGTKVKVLYIAKSSAGNLWGSIEWEGGTNGVAYICLNNCKAV